MRFLQTCGMHFLCVSIDKSWYKNVSFTFFQPFLAVSCRFGSILKQPYFVTYFNLRFDCLNNQFDAVSLFPPSHHLFLPLFYLYINESVSYTGLLWNYSIFRIFCSIVLFQKISIPLPRKVFWFKSPTPLEFPLKPHTFLLKFWPLRPPTPSNFHWPSMGWV